MTRGELERNPFWVLGVPPTATRLEVERAGQKLLAQLSIAATSAQTYATPFGPRPRDEALVRNALAVLRAPEERVLLELWADTAATPEASAGPAPWPDALASIAWKAPCPG
jgi:hypothetical protein